MKSSRLIVSILTVVLLCLAGCSKPAKVEVPATTVNGATFDMEKLRQALASSTSADVKRNMGNLIMNVRYTQYDKAASDLDKLAADPSLTDDQKKAVGDAVEQLKQVAAAASKPAQ